MCEMYEITLQTFSRNNLSISADKLLYCNPVLHLHNTFHWQWPIHYNAGFV